MKDRLIFGFYIDKGGNIDARGDLGGFNLPNIMTLIEAMALSMGKILASTRQRTAKLPDEMSSDEMAKIIRDGRGILEGRKY